MDISVKMQDRHGARPAVDAGVLTWQNGAPISARRLIEERVRLERDARAKGPGGRRKSDFNNWLARNPENAAVSPAGPALSAFSARDFALVVDGTSLKTLDDEVKLHPGSAVIFLRQAN
jgi:hypothetical protein